MGPRTDPCGTPYRTADGVEQAATMCLLLVALAFAYCLVVDDEDLHHLHQRGITLSN